MKKPEIPPTNLDLLETGNLLDLLKDSKALNQLFEIEKDYPYWEKFKYKVKDLNYPDQLLWQFIKIHRERGIYKFELINDPKFTFKFNNAGSKILELLHQFDLNLGGFWEGGAIIPDTEKERLLVSSLMEEAIASSQLEGAATTREVAKKMLREKRRPKNHSEKMILNNYLTIQEILKLKDEKLTVDLIRKIHSIITADTLENKENEGRFRENDNVNVVDHITGETYYFPPSHVLVDTLMEEFCSFANKKNDPTFIHPIIRGIILHFLIGYIHPFVDGNGRTARAIFYWYLVKQRYWLIEFMSISKIIIKSPAQYARAYLFSEYDENDLTYFIDFNLKSMDLALKSLKEHISRKITEKKQLTQLILKDNFNERQAEIIKDFINDPNLKVTINEIQSMYRTAYQTARTDLLGLVTMGYLAMRQTSKKIFFFKSEDFEQKIKKIYSN